MAKSLASAAGAAAGGPVLAAAKGTKNLASAAGGVVGATAGKVASNISPKQFGTAGKALGGAVLGSRLGPVGAVAGGAVGAGLASGTIQRNAATGAKNAGNIAAGAAGGAVGGAKKGFKIAGPLGGLVGGEIGAVKGAASSAAGKNVLHGMGTGAKWGLLGGPAGAAAGAIAGGIAGLFHHRGNPKPAAPGVGKQKATPAPAASSQYTIKRGDNLYNVAKANGTTLDAVRKANPKMMANPKYKNGSMVWAGTKVNLPAGAKAPAASTATKVPNRAVAQPKALAKAGGVGVSALGAVGSAFGNAAPKPNSAGGRGMGMPVAE